MQFCSPRFHKSYYTRSHDIDNMNTTGCLQSCSCDDASTFPCDNECRRKSLTSGSGTVRMPSGFDTGSEHGDKTSRLRLRTYCSKNDDTGIPASSESSKHHNTNHRTSCAGCSGGGISDATQLHVEQLVESCLPCNQSSNEAKLPSSVEVPKGGSRVFQTILLVEGLACKLVNSISVIVRLYFFKLTDPSLLMTCRSWLGRIGASWLRSMDSFLYGPPHDELVHLLQLLDQYVTSCPASFKEDLPEPSDTDAGASSSALHNTLHSQVHSHDQQSSLSSPTHDRSRNHVGHEQQSVSPATTAITAQSCIRGGAHSGLSSFTPTQNSSDDDCMNAAVSRLRAPSTGVWSQREQAQMDFHAKMPEELSSAAAIVKSYVEGHTTTAGKSIVLTSCISNGSQTHHDQQAFMRASASPLGLSLSTSPSSDKTSLPTPPNSLTISALLHKHHLQSYEEIANKLIEVILFVRDQGEDPVLTLAGGEESLNPAGIMSVFDGGGGERLDPLNAFVEGSPMEALWFMKMIMIFGTMVGVAVCVPCLIYLNAHWQTCMASSCVLTLWILLSSLLQLMPMPIRIAFCGKLASLDATNRQSIILAIQRMTKSPAWKLTKCLTLLMYVWYVFGIVGLYLLSPASVVFNNPNSSPAAEDYSPPSLSTPSSTDSTTFSSTPLLLSSSLPSLFLTSCSAPFLKVFTASVICVNIGRLFVTWLGFVYSFPGLRYRGTRRLGGIGEAMRQWYQGMEKRKCMRKAALIICSIPKMRVGLEGEWKEMRRAWGIRSEGCSICLGDFVQDDNVRFLNCQHSFHQKCIDKWLVRSAACPLCLRPIAESLHSPLLSS
eukprot:GHVQ01001781.1.p1 GENE.GHVQ01001781.1~~GHVQ01001781.1.p1  ORF type:complete len:831 (-),score=117.58 GHVQ01001781.1:2146-4638(-)